MEVRSRLFFGGYIFSVPLRKWDDALGHFVTGLLKIRVLLASVISGDLADFRCLCDLAIISCIIYFF